MSTDVNEIKPTAEPRRLIYPRHLPLDRLKTIAARMLYFDSVSENHAHPYLQDKGLADVLQEFYECALDNSNHVRAERGGPLDEFVTAVVDELDDLAKKLKLSSNESQIVTPLLGHLRQKVVTLKCHTCSPIPAAICCAENIRRNDEIITRSGACIKSLKQWFQLATQTAESYYRTHATGCPTLLPSMELSTAFKKEVAGPFHVTGETEYREDGVCIIKLIFDTAHFDRESYESVPYILFHECICHAFQGFNIPDRKHCSADDSFAEGWMDWAAYSALERTERAHRATGPGGTPPPPQRVHRRHISIANRFHDWRWKDSVQVRNGVVAASRFFDLLDELLEPKDPFEATWNAFFRITFDLNLAHQPPDWNAAQQSPREISNRGKQELCRRLIYCLPDSDPEFACRQHVKSITENYLQSNDSEAFIREILRIKI